MPGEEQSGRQPLSTFPQPREGGRRAVCWEAMAFPNLVVALQALGGCFTPVAIEMLHGGMRDVLLPSPGGRVHRAGCFGKSTSSWGDVSGRVQAQIQACQARVHWYRAVWTPAALTCCHLLHARSLQSITPNQWTLCRTNH